MTEKHIVVDEKKVYEDLCKYLEEKYTLTFVDWRYESVPPRVVEECLEAGSAEPLYEKDYYWEQRDRYAHEELDRLLRESGLDKDQQDLFRSTGEYQDLLDDILERDESQPEKELLEHSCVYGRIQLISNYDCICPSSTYKLFYSNSGMQALLELLSLNPAKVRATAIDDFEMEDTWPDIPSREGYEIIGYRDFVDVLANRCGAGNWCFFGKLPLGLLLGNDFSTDDCEIPAGTVSTLYNAWDGSGSLTFAETVRPLPIKTILEVGSKYSDLFRICVDEKNAGNGYSSYEVYDGRIGRSPLLAKVGVARPKFDFGTSRKNKTERRGNPPFFMVPSPPGLLLQAFQGDLSKLSLGPRQLPSCVQNSQSLLFFARRTQGHPVF